MTIREYLIQSRSSNCSIMTLDGNQKPIELWDESVVYFYSKPFHNPKTDDNSKFLPDEDLCSKEILRIFQDDHTHTQLWV